MGGGAVTEFIYCECRVACCVHGAAPTVLWRAGAPGSQVPVFFCVGAAVHKDLEWRGFFCIRGTVGGAVDCCEVEGAVASLVCGCCEQAG